MAKDEQGIDPKAKDAMPNGKPASSREEKIAADELAMRKARQEAAEREQERATGMSDHGKRGQPIDDQPEPAEPTEAELFPMGSIPGDHRITMKTIVPPGLNSRRKAEAKMRATPIAMRDGLRAYGELVELLVTVEAGKVEEVPDLEDQDTGGRRKLLGVKDVQHFRPVHVKSAEGLYTLEQVLDILEREFGVTRSADKVREVFGIASPPAVAAVS